MLHWLTRIALELLGQGGFGYSFDTLTEEGSNPLADDLKAVMYVFLSAVYQLVANDFGFPLVRLSDLSCLCPDSSPFTRLCA